MGYIGTAATFAAGAVLALSTGHYPGATPDAPPPITLHMVTAAPSAGTVTAHSPAGSRCTHLGARTTWTSPVTHRTYAYACAAVPTWRRVK